MFDQNIKPSDFYLVNGKSNLYRSVLVNFCYDVLRVRSDFVRANTVVFRFTPELVSGNAFPHTFWCRVCGFTSRVRASGFVKVWITLKSQQQCKSSLNQNHFVLVCGQNESFYLFGDYTVVFKVPPCRNWVATITTLTAEESTTC